MKSVCNENIGILPLLMVAKTYMGFIMNNSPYHFSFSVVLIPIIWLYVIINYKKYILNKSVSFYLSFFIIAFFFLIISLTDSFFYGKSTLLDISFFFILASMPLEEKKKTFEIFFNFGTILLVFSIIEYFLFVLFGAGIILTTFDRGESFVKDSLVMQGLFNFYSLNSNDLMRFQSLFREPGHLGQCAGLMMLLWGRVNSKKLLVWFVAGMMSMSFFFYVFLLLVVAYHFRLIFKMKTLKSRNYLKSYLLIIVMIVGAIYILPRDLKEILFLRAENMIEAKGDNRSSDELNHALVKMVDNGKLMGYGATSFYKNEMSTDNTGIKADLYKIGFIGVGLVLICYLILINSFHISSSQKFYWFLFFLILYYNADIKFELYINILLFYIFLQPKQYIFYGKTSN